MMLAEDPTLYDLLEVAPDASEQEIRAAYMRAKSAYKKDSVALYSLMGKEETQELLEKIEEAYKILSSPEKRRNYDASHGVLGSDSPLDPNPRPFKNQKIVSIDRVPPMERSSDDSELLIPPSTDFQEPAQARSSTPPRESALAEPARLAAAPTSSAARPFAEPQHSNYGPLSGHSSRKDPKEIAAREALIAEIAQETEWSGSFLQKIRIAKNASIEEIADFTKISKTYLKAVEDENHAKLPAPVYVRGFVTQLAKYLRLPTEKVVPAYMARFQAKIPPQ